MRHLLLLMMLSIGCGDDGEMMSPPDLSGLISLDDLSTMQCSGAAGTCLGMPCGGGCKCSVVASVMPTDAGDVDGPLVGVCVCSPVVPFDGPIQCCGGVACLTKSSGLPTCHASDCSSP